MTGRWLSRTFIASVVLNLFLLGVGGTMLLMKANDQSPPNTQRSPLRTAAASLTEAHRTAFLELLRTEGKAIEADNRQARRFREAAWASLSASTFSPAEAETALARARSLNLQTRGTVEAAVMQFAAELPQGERAAFGESMRRAVARQHADANPPRPEVH